MKKLWAAVFAALVLCTPAIAQNETEGEGWALDVRAGSLGIGADLSRSIVPGLLNVRAGASFFAYSSDLDISGITYESRLKLGGVPIAVDVFPFRNWFRIGGGMIINLNEVSGNTPSAGIVTIGGNQYNIQDFGRLDVKTNLNRVAPYFGVGFNNPIKKSGRFGFFTDIGFMYHGTPTATLTPGISVPQLQADIDEEMQEVNNEIEDYKFFPIVQLGISYRF